MPTARKISKRMKRASLRKASRGPFFVFTSAWIEAKHYERVQSIAVTTRRVLGSTKYTRLSE